MSAKRANVLMLTHCTESYWPINEVTMPGKIRYCLRWQFGCMLRRYDHVVWGDRQRMVSDVLPLCDWVWFVGADVAITSMTVDARRFCDPAYHLVVGMERGNLNNDSYFIRNDPLSFAYLQRVIDYTDLNDQASMGRVIRDMPEVKVKAVPQRLFNGQHDAAYGYEPHPEHNWAYGDIAYHPHGLPFNNRLQTLRDNVDIWEKCEPGQPYYRAAEYEAMLTQHFGVPSDS